MHFKNDVIATLRKNVNADVHADPFSKKIWSVDASIYELEPHCIVLPRTRSALIEATRIALQAKVPITPRGAATGLTGGCLGEGIVIDTSKYLRNILEINYSEEYAICEPGVVQDQLNAALAEKGYRLGPDTSTGNRATLGGMVANNSSGAKSLKYGRMIDHVQEVEMVLSNGEVSTFSDHTDHPITQDIRHIRDIYADEIKTRFPDIPKRVSGYNLNELLKSESIPLTKLITGSEGTLGIITKMKVRIVKCPQNPELVVIHFHDLLDAFRVVEEILSYHPISLEVIDHHILESGRKAPSMRDNLDWLKGDPKAILVAEFEGSAEQFLRSLARKELGYAHTHLPKRDDQQHVWNVRKSGLGLLLSKRSYTRAITFLEDISVAPEKLHPFMMRFISYLKDNGKEAGVYGHAGSGCLHIRPYINLRQQEERELMVSMMRETTDIIIEYGGALSGEHGDGFARTWLNEQLFGSKLYQAFKEVKAAFDPVNLMNPGKIVDGPSPLVHLRKPSPYTINTFLDFQREGGFELSADLCNGNGLCRKPEKIMCPSFQVTQDEYHTTRARAQSLRTMPFVSDEMNAVLEHCIECKGCKTECPSQVDMAKMKAEFLYQYHQKHGYPLRSYLFGHIATLNKLSAPFAPIFNRISNIRLSKKILGITQQRELPSIVKQRFSTWFSKYSQPNHNQQVVLFNDTFNEFNHPEIGIAAVKVLNSMGYRVIVPPFHCCGRPLISKGLLKSAKTKASKLSNILSEYHPLPIIGLEPSCILTIKDDYPDLRETMKSECLTFDEFIYNHMDQLPQLNKKDSFLLHGHCHQKSLVGMKPTLHVLNQLSSTVNEIPSGCCGMAGSFGYEQEHYDFSLKIAELSLAPAIRAASNDTVIVANGFSCRCQIAHTTERKASHLAEVIATKIMYPKRL